VKPRHHIVTIGAAAAAAWAGAAAPAHAQSSQVSQPAVRVYGRVDLSVAQQADAQSNRQLRNGSGSRFGLRGVEDLGGGLRAVFQFEHRFNANDGTQSTTRFWEGKSIVGLEGGFGRITLGREENPAYTFGQVVADPWGTDTVASNGTIINGRIGTTRYSNSINYRINFGDFTFAAQGAEADGNTPTGGAAEKRPYSMGAGWSSGPWRVGVGFENPADRDDRWASVAASYDFGLARVGAFFGSGKNVDAQKIEGWLVSAVAPVGAGEVRASYGTLKNKDIATDDELDEQFGVGYHHALSKRTTLYADVVHERRDSLPDGRRKTGYDVGLKHNF
jgi:predicted porin